MCDNFVSKFFETEYIKFYVKIKFFYIEKTFLMYF